MGGSYLFSDSRIMTELPYGFLAIRYGFNLQDSFYFTRKGTDNNADFFPHPEFRDLAVLIQFFSYCKKPHRLLKSVIGRLDKRLFKRSTNNLTNN